MVIAHNRGFFNLDLTESLSIFEKEIQIAPVRAVSSVKYNESEDAKQFVGVVSCSYNQGSSSVHIKHNHIDECYNEILNAYKENANIVDIRKFQ